MAMDTCKTEVTSTANFILFSKHVRLKCKFICCRFLSFPSPPKADGSDVEVHRTTEARGRGGGGHGGTHGAVRQPDCPGTTRGD